MTSIQTTLFPDTPDYQPLPDAWDEMWDPQAGVRPHWRDLVTGLSSLAARDWSARNQRIKRLLRENGVTYHVYDDPRGYTRTWELDPVPLVLDAGEWSAIEAGLEQRARLLDLLLRDLYGPQTLLRRGLLPPELILVAGNWCSTPPTWRGVPTAGCGSWPTAPSRPLAPATPWKTAR